MLRLATGLVAGALMDSTRWMTMPEMLTQAAGRARYGFVSESSPSAVKLVDPKTGPSSLPLNL